VLVNEDFPSLASSSRNACLDAIDSCDYVITIIGHRGGWTAPSGRLIVEEEYEHARACKLPVLLFLQAVDRDADAVRLAQRLSDFVDGGFRRTFSTPEELRDEIERALRTLLAATPTSKTMRRQTRDYFAAPYKVPSATMLRFVLLPEREEEVIDPVRIGSEEFRARVYEIAHSSSVRLFSYERPKLPKIEEDSLVITQTEARGRHDEEAEHARLQLTEAGEIVIDANVTGRVQRGSRHSMFDTLIVALEDVESVLAISFSFAAAIYDEIDPFKRHQRFNYNVALTGLDSRTLERNPRERSSYTMSMRGQGTIVAFDAFRLIERSDLRSPQGEIGRAVTLLTRKAGD